VLASYPVEATQENWLNDGIAAILTRALDLHPEPMTDWLLEFPEQHQDEVRRKTSLRERLASAVASIAALDGVQRDALRGCITQQNDLPAVFSSLIAPAAISAEPAALKRDISQLFEKAFELLTDLGIRDRQYRQVYEGVREHVCGFCGIERLSAPDGESPREDLDHYLAASLYPLAGANMRNLAPIGGRCNKSFKRAKDMLRGNGGAPRRCFDPYGDQQATVSLIGSQPLRRIVNGTEMLPDWDVRLAGSDADRIETWDDVFDIRRRYRRDVLDADFSNWMTHFAHWARGGPPVDRDTLVATIRHYLDVVIQEGIADGNFLKRATFQMLEHRLLNGPEAERITLWLLSLWDPEEGVLE
jgi:hypothetical protein